MSEGYGSHEVAQSLDITISSVAGEDLVLLSPVFTSTFGRELIDLVSKSVMTPEETVIRLVHQGSILRLNERLASQGVMNGSSITCVPRPISEDERECLIRKFEETKGLSFNEEELAAWELSLIHI